MYAHRGDKGDTNLGNETVSKFHPKIRAIGCLEELSASLGVVIAYCIWTDAKLLREIQQDILIIITQLTGIDGVEIGIDRISYLEEYIDNTVAKLKPIQSFIIPGGDPGAAMLHLVRTVCRRAERELVVLVELPENILIYVNRLSDLLFALARKCNDNGTTDILFSRTNFIKGD